MKHIAYWTYIEKELSELTDSFVAVFQMNALDRDYENVWEWLEGYSDTLKADINITRPHNWEKGEYDKPLQIRIRFDEVDEIEEEWIDTTGKQLAMQLNTDIVHGKIIYIKGNDYEFIALKNYSV